MSGLETLPPDQRAVLQLILVQGRGYADLAATLKLDPAAVRTRAHAGADALASSGGRSGDAGLDAATRGRVVDYLLGQQDEGERIVTFAELGDSPAACRWAQSLRESLAAVARGELPEVPAAAATARNGNAAHVVAAPPLAPTAAAPPPPPSPLAPTAQRSSRLGGAILIAGGAALAIVLAIVLIGGGDDDSPGASPSTSARTQTQPSTRAQTPTTPAGSQQTAARIVAQVNLTATSEGGGAIGVGLVQQAANRRRAIAIQAQRLPANGAQDIYAAWLQGTAGVKFLGFVPRQVRANGSFTVTAALPANASSYQTVLITREGVTAVPTAPGTTILSGALRLTG